jgi:hypothetical protein
MKTTPPAEGKYEAETQHLLDRLEARALTALQADRLLELSEKKVAYIVWVREQERAAIRAATQQVRHQPTSVRLPSTGREVSRRTHQEVFP